jgi:hypothetical protein
MLLKLAEHIRDAQERALYCAEHAAMANSPNARAEWVELEHGWSRLAESYLFVESVERFILDMDRAKAS